MSNEVQGQIDQIMEQSPPGSESYRAPEVQARLQSLRGQLPAQQDAGVHEPLPPMEPPPPVESAVVDAAAITLRELSEEGAALVDEWGSGFSQNFAYAKKAYEEIVSTRPDLVEAVERSGLGNDPALIKFLGEHGRLKAGFKGELMHDYPSYSPPAQRGASSSLQEELQQLLEDNPPGSEKYKSARVQRRVFEINRQLHGDAPVVGRGGRNS